MLEKVIGKKTTEKHCTEAVKKTMIKETSNKHKVTNKLKQNKVRSTRKVEHNEKQRLRECWTHREQR